MYDFQQVATSFFENSLILLLYIPIFRNQRLGLPYWKKLKKPQKRGFVLKKISYWFQDSSSVNTSLIERLKSIPCRPAL